MSVLLHKNSDDVKVQVFAGLEAERQKLEDEIERMQQRMAGSSKFTNYYFVQCLFQFL